MRAALDSFSRVLDLLCRVLLWIAGAGLFFMTLIIAWQVFGRFVLNNSPSWTEPASLMMMLWFILLAAAVGVRQRFHLSLDLFRMLVSPTVRMTMDILGFVAVGAFGGGMLWYTRTLIVQTWDAEIPGLGLPTGLSYLPIALAGFMIVVFSLEHIARLLLDGDEGVGLPGDNSVSSSSTASRH